MRDRFKESHHGKKQMGTSGNDGPGVPADLHLAVEVESLAFKPIVVMVNSDAHLNSDQLGSSNCICSRRSRSEKATLLFARENPASMIPPPLKG